MLEHPEETSTERRQDPGPILTAATLAAILVLGLALRLFRLGEESAWWDEFTSLTYLDAPSLWKFLVANRTLDPATLPLYYTLEYLWWHHVSASVYSLRLMSIAIGLAGIVLLCRFGCDLFGKRAGLAAALCAAVSPVHVHHAQGIRMYVVMLLLALFSAWTFMRLVRSWRKRWWAAHLLGNLLLLWTHPFAVLVVVVEGLYMAAFCLRPVKRAAAWAGLACLVALPSVVYLSRVRFWSPQTTSSWLKMPGFGEFLGDLFSDDVVSFSYQLRLSDYWAAAPLRGILDWALAAILLGGCIWLGWTRWKGRGTDRDAFQVFAFLAAWMLVPAVLLYLLSLAWRPCIFPRYTLHSSLALYLMLGGAVQEAERTWKAAVAALTVAALIGFQWVMLQPGPQRTDYRSAAALVRKQAKPQDLVLVRVSIWRDVFRYNLGPSDLAIASAESVQTLAGLTGFYLDRCGQPGVDKEPVVWAALQTPYFDSGPNREFEQALNGLGLSFKRTEFRGIEHILVYRVTRGATGPVEWKRLNNVDTEEKLNAVSDLALELAWTGNRTGALAALDWLFETDPDTGSIYGTVQRALLNNSGVHSAVRAVRCLLEAYQDLGRRDFIGSGNASREALRHDPEFAPAHANLAVTMLLAEKDEAGALESLRRACLLDANYRKLFGAFLERWSAGNYRACYEKLQGLGVQQEFCDWFLRRAEASSTPK